MVRAAGTLHNHMLANVLRSPMSFFDTTPSGRIMNRFSGDVETVDNTLPSLFRSWMNTFFGTISTIIVISYSTPIFMVVILPLGVLYYLVQRFYIPTSRQLKRIESTTKSPVFTHFTETITGATSIQ
uniref:ABC transmembrane type-1 domain-containing protein n=1 Tax=Biomphalaria glabrata TaxID=6526 RepID=A0A2C9M896_BIOGL